jgi:hypothetical protein
MRTKDLLFFTYYRSRVLHWRTLHEIDIRDLLILEIGTNAVAYVLLRRAIPKKFL